MYWNDIQIQTQMNITCMIQLPSRGLQKRNFKLLQINCIDESDINISNTHSKWEIDFEDKYI